MAILRAVTTHVNPVLSRGETYQVLEGQDMYRDYTGRVFVYTNVSAGDSTDNIIVWLREPSGFDGGWDRHVVLDRYNIQYQRVDLKIA